MSTSENSVKPKKPKRPKTPGKPTDAIAREHSKRHGKATKNGIKQAQEAKRAMRRASSRGRGKSKTELVRHMFVREAQAAATAPAAASAVVDAAIATTDAAKR